MRLASRGRVVSVRVATLDHLVLTVASTDASIAFYERLGMRGETSATVAVRCASAGSGCTSTRPARRSSRTRFVPSRIGRSLLPGRGFARRRRRELAEAGIAIELGPVERLGAVGAMESLYLRDPDGNLVELARPR